MCSGLPYMQLSSQVVSSSFLPGVQNPSTGATGNYLTFTEPWNSFEDWRYIPVPASEASYRLINRDGGSATNDFYKIYSSVGSFIPTSTFKNLAEDVGSNNCTGALFDDFLGAYYAQGELNVIAVNGGLLSIEPAGTLNANGEDPACYDLSNGTSYGLEGFAWDEENGAVFVITDSAPRSVLFSVGNNGDLSGPACFGDACFSSVPLGYNPSAPVDLAVSDENYFYAAASFWDGSGAGQDKTVVRRALPGLSGSEEITLSDWGSDAHGPQAIVADLGIVYVIGDGKIATIPDAAWGTSGGNHAQVTYTDFNSTWSLPTGVPPPEVARDPVSGLTQLVARDYDDYNDYSATADRLTFDLADCAANSDCESCSAAPQCVWCSLPAGCYRGDDIGGALTSQGDCFVRIGNGLDSCDEGTTGSSNDDDDDDGDSDDDESDDGSIGGTLSQLPGGSVGVLGVAALLLVVGVLAGRKSGAPPSAPPPPPPDVESLELVKKKKEAPDAPLAPIMYGGMETAAPTVADKATQKALDTLVALMIDSSDEWSFSRPVLSTVSGPEQEEYAKAVTYLAADKGKFLDLLQTSFKAELEKESDPTQVFRGSGGTGRLMTAYARLVGMKYLHSTLSPMMTVLLEGDMEVEVNPSRAEDGADAYVAKWTLMALAQRLLNDILSSVNALPKEFRVIAAGLKATVTEVKGADYEGHSVVGGFLFLRFFAPAITAPDAFNLATGDVLDAAKRRSLILLAKLIQNLANGVEFGTKEEHMIELNEFVKVNSGRIEEFFAAVEGGDSGSKTNGSRLGRTDIPKAVAVSAVQRAHRVLHSNLTPVALELDEKARAGFRSLMEDIGEPIKEPRKVSFTMGGATKSRRKSLSLVRQSSKEHL